MHRRPRQEDKQSALEKKTNGKLGRRLFNELEEGKKKILNNLKM